MLREARRQEQTKASAAAASVDHETGEFTSINEVAEPASSSAQKIYPSAKIVEEVKYDPNKEGLELPSSRMSSR